MQNIHEFTSPKNIKEQFYQLLNKLARFLFTTIFVVI